MLVEKTSIPGCLLIDLKQHSDHRGLFVKTFQSSCFRDLEIDSEFCEDFYSRSKKGVMRGMHFQVPPHDHSKVVTCLTGKILDVVVDLRKGSPSFGQSYSIELHADSLRMLYIPKGCAHGFLSLTSDSLVYYKVTREHSPACDRGIRWDSFGYNWPCENPIISSRDASFVLLEEFDSPFTYDLR